MRTLIAISKLLLFFMLCLIVVPPQIILLFFNKGSCAFFIPQIFHKGVCRIFQIRVIISGNIPCQKSKAIYVSNHLSYLDVPVIGSYLRASFVAKDDVSNWPVFGFLSKLQQTLFISRDRNKATDGQVNLDNALLSGKSIILFPEGTSTDGRSIFPFKSSLFSIAFTKNSSKVSIRPFTINLIRADGRVPQQQGDRDYYAWHIKMDTPLHKHLWLFAKGKGAEIELNFAPMISTSTYSDRKELAKICQEAVSKGLNNC